MSVSRPSTGGPSRPTLTIPGQAEAVAGGSSWVTLTAATATTTLAGQGSTTWSDETGDELRATVDLTTSQVFNNLTNHGGMLIYDTGLLVSDHAIVDFRFTPSTTPASGSDVNYVFGVIIAADESSLTFTSDKSTWWLNLFGPTAAPGTTDYVDVSANNLTLGSGGGRALAGVVTFQVSVVGGMMSSAGHLVYNTTSMDRQAITTNITGLTSTHKVLVFVAGGHRIVDAGGGSQPIGGKLSMLVSAGPS